QPLPPVPGLTHDLVDRTLGVGRDLRLQLLHHDPEQVALVLELVVQSTPGHPGDLNDFLRRGLVVPALREQLTGGGNERLVRSLALLLVLCLFFHTARMFVFCTTRIKRRPARRTVETPRDAG